MATTTWSTYVDGEHVGRPATIDDIRAALPAERGPEFDRAVGTAGLHCAIRRLRVESADLPTSWAGVRVHRSMTAQMPRTGAP